MGRQGYFGMKARTGVNAKSGLIHTIISTAANVNHVTQAGALIHGEQMMRRPLPQGGWPGHLQPPWNSAFHDQHRHLGVGQHLLRHAAEDQGLHTLTAM